MQANLGKIDRELRIVIGLVLVLLAITGTVGWWGWLGLILVATGAVRFCPVYRLLGISTISKSK